MDIFFEKKLQFDFKCVFTSVLLLYTMSYFFEKIKIIFKIFFSGHFITKKNPTSKWTFFSKKNLQFDFKCVFTSVLLLYTMSYFFEKIKIIFKNLFSGHFITKKNPTSKWTFFSKKNF